MSETPSDAEVAIAIRVAAGKFFEEFTAQMEQRGIRLSVRDQELVRQGYVSGFAAGVLMTSGIAED